MLVVMYPDDVNALEYNEHDEWLVTDSMCYRGFGQCREVLVDVLFETVAGFGRDWSTTGTVDIYGITRPPAGSSTWAPNVPIEVNMMASAFFDLVSFLTENILRVHHTTSVRDWSRYMFDDPVTRTHLPSPERCVFDWDLTNNTYSEAEAGHDLDAYFESWGGRGAEHRGTSITNIPITWLRYRPVISLITYALRVFSKLTEWGYRTESHMTHIGVPHLVGMRALNVGMEEQIVVPKDSFELWSYTIGVMGSSFMHFRYGGEYMWTFLYEMIDAVANGHQLDMDHELTEIGNSGYISWVEELLGLDSASEVGKRISNIIDIFGSISPFLWPRSGW